MEKLVMSRKERTRLEVFSRVKAGQITKVKAAALLGLSYRQTLRAYRRYARRGAAGLVHGLRGKASNRGHDRSHRRNVLAAYRRSYGDFGPTLAAEQMAARDDLAVDHETLRRWLVDEGLWKGSRKRQQHRTRRDRKAHAGELVQLDGSPHDWLEGRGGSRLTLVEFVDDATGRAYGRFYAEETTEAVMDCLGRYARRHGLPRALYVDKDSIYTVNNREATGAEILAGREPQTQFARAAAELGVEIILANSPQAKGRVERVHGTHQDRLVKLMRLAGGITTMAEANAYLEDHYWSSYNAKFAVAAAESADLHHPAALTAASLAALDAALCVKEPRTVGRDWCVCYERRVLQVAAKHQSLALAGRRVEVRAHAGGRLAVWFAGRELEYQELGDRPKPIPEPRPTFANNKTYKPPADHPHRRAIVEPRRGVPPGSSATPQTPAAPRGKNVTVLTS
jgi:transposase